MSLLKRVWKFIAAITFVELVLWLWMAGTLAAMYDKVYGQ